VIVAVSAHPEAMRTARSRGSRLAQLPSWVLGLAGIALFLLVWEAIPRLGLANPEYLPPASEVLQIFFRNLGLTSFWVAVGHTMTGWALGLAIASTAAVVLGLVIGSSRFLREATHSTIEFLRPIPSVALIPLAVLLFGVSLQSTLLLVVYASFWQVLIQVLYGVTDVDVVASNTARSYGLGRWARVRHVVWPTTLPYLMTGLRLGAAVALILAVTSELVIGVPGLGHEIALAQSGGATTSMYALVLATGMIGVAINIGMRFVERRVLSWHPSVRGEVRT
jgi:ABC-type nitrate/sulfonate/bicarbonate transport system permease component